jgi:methylenetetrahydrofolate reductase (NADPH)
MQEQSAPRAPISALHARLLSGEFVVTAEITPPVSTDPSEFVARAAPLKGLAAALNVTDGAGAKAHLSTLVAAHFIAQSGIEPIVQMTCRDRNRLALQADLLGAAALGLRNVLLLGGDNPASGDQPEAKAVGDYDSRGLLAAAHRMRTTGTLPPGTEIKGGLRLLLGTADLPIDPPAGWEPKGLIAKIEAGADFAQTQFCMDIEVVRRYAARLVELGVAQKLPILIGVAPIPSVRSARWMKEKLYGTVIPERIIERLERAADAKAEGEAICAELLRELSETPGIAGAHVMAPQNFSGIARTIAASGVVGGKRAAMLRR